MIPQLAILLCASALTLGATDFPVHEKERIIGGKPATIEDHPHQVLLMRDDNHYCGGSIIDKTHIVTAAHCTNGQSAESLKIRAGSSIFDTDGVVIAVAKIYQCPNYDHSSHDYDVSVLKLAEPLQYGKGIGPINLPSEELVAGTYVNITGWGYTTESSNEPAQQLQAVEVPIIDREKCKEAYGEDRITDRMICAGYLDIGGKDSCQGDSGGPLSANGTLYGIVSWGNGCGRPKYPGVYSNVVNLLKFIKSALEKDMLSSKFFKNL